MPLQIVRNDITKMKVDAIVNAANSSLSGGGGVDGCIHRAAGPELAAECALLHGCEVGRAKLTKGYRLPCKYVIHTVGPRWIDGTRGERDKLISCYSSSLALAKEYECESVAFPLISSGIFGYPKEQALKTAVDTIGEFLLENDMQVYLVIFDKNSYQIGGKLFADIASYIDDRYADEHTDDISERMRTANAFGVCKAKPKYSAACIDDDLAAPCDDAVCPDEEDFAGAICLSAPGTALPKALSLDDALEQIDESFSEMLLRKIDESGMTDAQCYKKANIDRKLFSKIRSDKHYKPSKSTSVAFGIALGLPMDEFRELVSKAGYSMTHASKFDIIVEYFVEHGNYDVFEINKALFAFDQSLIGA